MPEQPPLALDAVGPAATGGFASDRPAFAAAAVQVAGQLGLTPRFVVHDYWLVRSLHALSTHMPDDGLLEGGAGTWAFGGGTSLAATRGFVQRYSEDIDGVLFVNNAGGVQRNRQRSMCTSVAQWAIDDPDITASAPDGNRVLTSWFQVGDTPRFIKFETSIIEALPNDLIESREVKSLMHRRGDAAWRDEYPELGGFSLPCTRPAWIAVNKFDALHRRALSSDFKGLRERGRDLYDLWALSQQEPIAAEIRQRTPELWAPAAIGLGRSAAPRPDRGYADSPVFRSRTAARTALKRGFEAAVQNTIWGDAPEFEAAVAAVRSLDASADCA